jgi:lipid A disaccharide synthetase
MAEGRIKTIAKLVKAMIVVFPFEVPLYKTGVDVRFLGHPLTDVVDPRLRNRKQNRSVLIRKSARWHSCREAGRKKSRISCRTCSGPQPS